MNVEAYLKKTYGNCKKLKNGYYYVKAKDNTQIYVPKNFSSSTKVYAFLPGQGGGGAQKLKSKMQGSNPGDYLTIIAPNANDSTKVLNQANKIIKDNGSTVKGIVVDGFSMGARQTMVSLNNYLKKHPEQADSSAIIMTDGWIKNYYKRTDLDLLKEKNVKMIYVSSYDEKMEDRSSPKVKTIIKQLTEAGFNVVGVQSYDYGHAGINNDVISNGFAEFLFGDSKKIGNKNVNTNKSGYNPYYEFIVYDPKTRKYKSIFKMKKNMDFSLLDFLKLKYSDDKKTDVTIIQSDNKFLQKYLTNINRKLIKLSESKIKLTVSSTTKVPSCEVSLASTINSAIQNLCMKLYKDLVTIGKVGNKFKKLDIKLEKDAEKLLVDFKSALSATSLDIPREKHEKKEFSLDQLISDYNQYLKENGLDKPHGNQENEDDSTKKKDDQQQKKDDKKDDQTKKKEDKKDDQTKKKEDKKEDKTKKKPEQKEDKTKKKKQQNNPTKKKKEKSEGTTQKNQSSNNKKQDTNQNNNQKSTNKNSQKNGNKEGNKKQSDVDSSTGVAGVQSTVSTDEETKDIYTGSDTVIDDEEEKEESMNIIRPNPISSKDSQTTKNVIKTESSKDEGSNEYIDTDEDTNSSDDSNEYIDVDEQNDDNNDIISNEQDNNGNENEVIVPPEPTDTGEPGIIIHPDNPVEEQESGIFIEETPDDLPKDQIYDIKEEEPKKEDDGILKTLGVITTVGAGIGASAYAAHKVVEKKKRENEY